jgi:hypothetical protein
LGHVFGVETVGVAAQSVWSLALPSEIYPPKVLHTFFIIPHRSVATAILLVLFTQQKNGASLVDIHRLIETKLND